MRTWTCLAGLLALLLGLIPCPVSAAPSAYHLSKVVMLIYCAFSTIVLATTVNSGCYVVAATATRRMPVDADPHRYHCTFWAVAQGLLALGLLAMGGLEVAKIFGNFSGALMALPSLLLTACWLKIIREDGKHLLITQVKKD